MIQYFLCFVKFNDIKSYINFLKMVHKCRNSTSNFSCTVCPQIFQSMYSFKRHIKKHVSIKLNISRCSSTINFENMRKSESHDSNKQSDKSNILEYSSVLNLDNLENINPNVPCINNIILKQNLNACVHLTQKLKTTNLKPNVSQTTFIILLKPNFYTLY